MSEQTEPESTDAAGTRDWAEVSLIEVAPGVAVVLGDHVPEGLEVEPFGLGEQQDQRLADALSLAVSSANVGATAASTLVSVQGLVRLAPETIQQMKTMTPLVKDGWNLGALMNGTKFGASVRGTSAVDAEAALAATSLGPQMALLAISAQLASISRRVDENIDLTRDVLEALHADHCHAIKAMYDEIDDALETARDAGSVTAGNVDRIKHLGPSLRKERAYFIGEVNKHVTALDADYAGRRKYLTENGRRIVGDLQGLLMAETASHRFHMLYAASLASSPDRSEAEDKTLRSIAERGIRQHEDVMERIAALLAQLDAHVQLADVLTGHALDPRDIMARRRQSAATAVTGMAEYVAALMGRAYSEPEPLVPAVTRADEEPAEKVLKVLRWVLPEDETLLALADLEPRRVGAGAGVLAVTQRSLILADRRDLLADGILTSWDSLDDVRYVRYREEKGGGRLDVILKDADRHVSIAGAVADDEARASAGRIVDLLTAAAHTPVEEKRTSELLQTSPTRAELLAGRTGE